VIEIPPEENYAENSESYIKILSYDLISIIMSGMAAHPQYSGLQKQTPINFSNLKEKVQGGDLDYVDYLSELFEKSLVLSTEIGTNIERPVLLCINHMYPDFPEKYFKRQQLDK
jgi:hypothetical protein